MLQVAFKAPMRIADQTLNRLKVLKAIQRNAPLSRSDLPALTGLSGGTITQVTGDLVRRGLLVETRDTARRRTGRPRTHLEIHAAGAVVIGVSLTENGVLEAAFVDLSGRRVFDVAVPLGFPRTLDAFAGELAEGLEHAIAASPYGADQISRVGIAVPGLVDNLRGIVHFVATMPPEPVPFARIIGERLGLPVTMENSRLCMARAEHWFGRAQAFDTFTLVSIAYDLGSAEYVAGLPRLGANGFNSELGHVKTMIGDDAPPCFCGGRGCVAAIASMYGITMAAGRFGELSREAIAGLEVSFGQVFDLADRGDAVARAAIDRAATHLGLALANHVNASDPGNVLVLSTNHRLQRALDGRVQKVMEQNVLPGLLDHTRIVFGHVDPEWRWKGSAALALERLYLDEYEPSGRGHQARAGHANPAIA